MGLYDINLRIDLPSSFEHDGLVLTPEIMEKYKRSTITLQNGQILEECTRFCKNASIFDLTGTKIVWGDFGPKDVEEMLGVYYVLSEHKSYLDVPKEAVKVHKLHHDDPFSQSPFRHLLPPGEPYILDIGYIKKNAIARIVNGEIQTNRDLIFLHYQ